MKKSDEFVGRLWIYMVLLGRILGRNQIYEQERQKKSLVMDLHRQICRSWIYTDEFVALLHKFDFQNKRLFTTYRSITPTNLSLLLHKFDFQNRSLFTTPK